MNIEIVIQPFAPISQRVQAVESERTGKQVLKRREKPRKGIFPD